MQDTNRKARTFAAICAVLAAATAGPKTASANLAGFDLNLSAHPATGGMAGAGYTVALEPSAAVFGNPASLTQMSGIQFNLGATYAHAFGIENQQSFLGLRNTSTSSVDDLVFPIGAATFELFDNFVLGVGFEVDAGGGTDYRLDPIAVLGTTTDTTSGGVPVPGTTVPAVSRLVSFNTNVGFAYDIAEMISIGAAMTLGYALGQLGTVGNTSGILEASGGAYDDFGGTTAIMDDFGFGASVGVNIHPIDGFYLSAAYKSPVKYEFRGVTSTTADGPQVYQTLTIQTPQEVAFGVALKDKPENLTLAFDVVWKNWENADALDDIWQNQWLLMFGGQYVIAKILAVRLGYSYQTPLLRDTPNNTFGELTGVGTVPLGNAGEPLSSAFLALTQTALFPALWQHYLTAGAGLAITDKVSVDVYAAVSLPNEESRNPAPLSEALQSPVVYEADLKPVLWVGAGVRVAIDSDDANAK